LIQVFSDSKNAIKAANEFVFVSIATIFENDGDIKSELRWQKQLSKFNIIMTHVKAHQGDDTDLQKLPLDQRLNRMMDTLAKRTFTDYPPSSFRGLVAPFLASNKVSIRSPYNRIVYDIKNKLNEYKIGHEAELLLARNWKIEASDLSLISWDNLKSVVKMLKKKSRYKAVKTVHGQWHTASRMCKWKQSDSHLCSLCKIHEEDCDHVLRCPSEEMTSFRTTQLLEFRELLEKMETSTIVRNRLMSMLFQWVGGFSTTEFAASENQSVNKLNAAFNEQVKIGVRNCFRGLLAKGIIALQEEHYATITAKKKNNIERWSRQVIQKLLTISMETWRHRCELVHEKEASVIETTTRTAAYDLCMKLKPRSWSLPSASRHLLDREKDFFVKSKIRDVSGWLRRV